MIGLTIKQLIQHIDDTAMSHPAVQQFGTGENFNISPGGDAKSVLVWLEQPFLSSVKVAPNRSALQSIDIRILVLDIPIQDDSDYIDILSKTYSVAAWLALRLRENPSSLRPITSDDEITILSVRDFGGDAWTGWRIEMSLLMQLPVDACDVTKFGI